MTEASTTKTTHEILIVDDTPTNLAILTRILSNPAYRVRPVTSGQAALRAARAAPPDLVLLDVGMPGMDGYEVCLAMKADPQLADIPVLFISGMASPQDKVRAYETGAADYITKPFLIEEVLARVRTQLRIRELEAHASDQPPPAGVPKVAGGRKASP
jgi:DNA-binding response OmpR family regulator